jgi:SAM-dependent methyltransferase
MDAHSWDVRYQEADFVWSVTPNATVERYLTGTKPGRALDLGSGEGRNAVWLATQGWDVTAVDFSAAGLEKARRLADSQKVELDLVKADVTQYEAGNREWDLVLLSYLQIPNPDRLKVLADAAQAVALDGIFFVIGHDRSNVVSGWGGPPDESVCYTVDETVSVLAGFDPIITEVLGREVATDDGTKIALDTLVVARRAS